MIDAAESIADNIAEGCGAATNSEFARFLDISIKSTSELENQLERCRGYKLIRTSKFEIYANEVCTIRKMTWGYRRKVLGDAELEPDPPTLNGRRVGERKTENE